MAQIDNKTSLSSEEKRSLAESARLCEMIVEANPSDTGALETLKEIYTKLGDRENLARVVARLAGTMGGRPSASVAPAPVPMTTRAPGRPPSTDEMEALAASIEIAPTPSSGKRGGASPTERRQGSLSRLGDRLVAEKLISTDQLQRALAEQKGAPKARDNLVRLNFITRTVSSRSCRSSTRCPRSRGAGDRIGRAQAVARADRQEAQRAPDQAMGTSSPWRCGSHQRLRARRRRFMTGLQIQPGAPRGGHPQGLRAPLRTGGSVTNDERAGRGDSDVEVVGRRDAFTRPTSSTSRKSRRGSVVRSSHDPDRRHRRVLRHPPGALREGLPGPVPHRRRLPEIMTRPSVSSRLDSRLKIMATMDIAERRLPRRPHQACATTSARSTSVSRRCRRSSARRPHADPGQGSRSSSI